MSGLARLLAGHTDPGVYHWTSAADARTSRARRRACRMAVRRARHLAGRGQVRLPRRLRGGLRLSRVVRSQLRRPGGRPAATSAGRTAPAWWCSGTAGRRLARADRRVFDVALDVFGDRVRLRARWAVRGAAPGAWSGPTPTSPSSTRTSTDSPARRPVPVSRQRLGQCARSVARSVSASRASRASSVRDRRVLEGTAAAEVSSRDHGLDGRERTGVAQHRPARPRCPSRRLGAGRSLGVEHLALAGVGLAERPGHQQRALALADVVAARLAGHVASRRRRRARRRAAGTPHPAGCRTTRGPVSRAWSASASAAPNWSGRSTVYFADL